MSPRRCEVSTQFPPQLQKTGGHPLKLKWWKAPPAPWVALRNPGWVWDFRLGDNGRGLGRLPGCESQRCPWLFLPDTVGIKETTAVKQGGTDPVRSRFPGSALAHLLQRPLLLEEGIVPEKLQLLHPQTQQSLSVSCSLLSR